MKSIKEDEVVKAKGQKKEFWGDKATRFKKLRERLPSLGKKTKYVLLTLFGILAFAILIFGALFFDLAIDSLRLKKSLQKSMRGLRESDLTLVKSGLGQSKVELQTVRTSYGRVSWMKRLPKVGVYFDDGEHLLNIAGHSLNSAEVLLAAIEPHAEIIGFKTNTSDVKSGVTTQDRVRFLVESTPDITDSYSQLEDDMNAVKDEIAYIDHRDYPETIFGRPVRENVLELTTAVDSATGLALDGKPLIEKLPDILGVNEQKTYLIIFQNDNELRATGGFMTAYTIAKVQNGLLEPGESDDIYNLDDKYEPDVPAPKPIVDYLKGPYLENENYRLRDMNWQVNFPDSMELFIEEAQEAGIEEVDGVIAVDTRFLTYLIDVIGVIQVPGYGGYSNDIVEVCDCEQIIYELEHFADREGPIVWSENEPGKIVHAPENYQDRKAILGPMMNVIVQRLFSLDNSRLPHLGNAIVKSLDQKHLLLYMKDDGVQNAIEAVGIGGTVKAYEGDYLYINDTNLGGKKANLYLQESVVQEIDFNDDGSVEKTLRINYKNPKAQDNWLNSNLPNYVRIFLPLGSEIVEVQGIEEDQEEYEQYGKTVLAGLFNVRPLGEANLMVKYKLPMKFEDNYKLLIQKQPGKELPNYELNIGKYKDEFVLSSDREFSLSL